MHNQQFSINFIDNGIDSHDSNDLNNVKRIGAKKLK